MPEDILDRHSRKGLLIDANLLVLLIIGALDRNQISTNNRTREYCPEDYDLLCAFLKLSNGPILTTPNILTETSNIVFASLNEPLRNRAMLSIRELASMQLKEEPVLSVHAVQEPIFTRLGLTDSGIAYLRRLKCVFLTVDSDLYVHLSRIGANVINFNHHRSHLSNSFKAT